MTRTLLALAAAVAIACPIAATAQDAHKAAPAPAPAAKAAVALSAEQILDKYIEATGGRDAYQKHTTVVMKGNVEVTGAGLNGLFESYNVAPNLLSSTIVLGGYGTVRQIYDGTHGWEASTLTGTRELDGVELALLQRQATFNADVKWREVWKSVELLGTQQSDNRPVYAVKLTPKEGQGNPVTNFYDTETFLIVKSETVVATEAATVPVTVMLSDYRPIAGVKVPFKTVQQLPTVTLQITLTEVTFDTKVDDAKFAAPK